MAQTFGSDHSSGAVSRRSALKSGAGLAAAGIVVAALPSSVAAASIVAPAGGEGVFASDQAPTATAGVTVTGAPIYLNVQWRTSEYEEVRFSYIWYWNDVTPRETGGSGIATGSLLNINMGNRRISGDTERWGRNNNPDGRTVSFYVMDSNGVRYKWENKYSNDTLTFVQY